MQLGTKMRVFRFELAFYFELWWINLENFSIEFHKIHKLINKGHKRKSWVCDSRKALFSWGCMSYYLQLRTETKNPGHLVGFSKIGEPPGLPRFVFNYPKV